jgi:hypothetical protein
MYQNIEISSIFGINNLVSRDELEVETVLIAVYLLFFLSLLLNVFLARKNTPLCNQILLSSTSVLLGLFLLFRFFPVIHNNDYFDFLVTFAIAITTYQVINLIFNANNSLIKNISSNTIVLVVLCIWLQNYYSFISAILIITTHLFSKTAVLHMQTQQENNRINKVNISIALLAVILLTPMLGASAFKFLFMALSHSNKGSIFIYGIILLSSSVMFAHILQKFISLFANKTNSITKQKTSYTLGAIAILSMVCIFAPSLNIINLALNSSILNNPPNMSVFTLDIISYSISLNTAYAYLFVFVFGSFLYYLSLLVSRFIYRKNLKNSSLLLLKKTKTKLKKTSTFVAKINPVIKAITTILKEISPMQNASNAFVIVLAVFALIAGFILWANGIFFYMFFDGIFEKQVSSFYWNFEDIIILVLLIGIGISTFIKDIDKKLFSFFGLLLVFCIWIILKKDLNTAIFIFGVISIYLLTATNNKPIIKTQKYNWLSIVRMPIILVIAIFISLVLGIIIVTIFGYKSNYTGKSEMNMVSAMNWIVKIRSLDILMLSAVLIAFAHHSIEFLKSKKAYMETLSPNPMLENTILRFLFSIILVVFMLASMHSVFEPKSGNNPIVISFTNGLVLASYVFYTARKANLRLFLLLGLILMSVFTLLSFTDVYKMEISISKYLSNSLSSEIIKILFPVMFTVALSSIFYVCVYLLFQFSLLKSEKLK